MAMDCRSAKPSSRAGRVLRIGWKPKAVMSEPLLRIASGADLHLQCCYMAASEMTSPHSNGVGKYTLACSDTAGKIAAQAGAKRLVLTHFRQTTPALIEEMRADIARDFSGPAEFSNDLDEFLV